MSANLRIVAKNVVDDPRCVLSCTVAEVLPLVNVQDYARERIFRAASGAAFAIKGTYGGDSVRASMAGLCRHNLEIDATWQFLGYASSDWTGSPAVDSGVLAAVDGTSLGDLDWGITPLGSTIFDPFYGQKMSQCWFASTAIASWKIIITDTTNTTGFIDISRIWVGKYFELAYNPAYGMKNAWKESTQQWEDEGGGIHADATIPFRRLAMSLDAIPAADRAKWMDILRYCGMRLDVFLSVYPEHTSGEMIRDYTMNALIVDMPDLATNRPNNDTVNLTFREV